MEDLTQAACVGMITAVPQWREEKGGFLTVAIFYMRRSIREDLGIHTAKERVENAGTASIDCRAGEDTETTLLDLLQDENATDPEQAAIERDTQRIVREAVNLLPETQRRAVLHRIYGSSPSPSTINERRAAIRALQKNKSLRMLWAEYENACHWNTGLAKWKNTQTSGPEAAAIYRERIMARLASLSEQQQRVNNRSFRSS